MRIRSLPRMLLVFALAAFCLPPTARAGRLRPHDDWPVDPRPSRVLLEFSSGAALPLGAFANDVDPTVHVDVVGAWQLGTSRRLGLRVSFMRFNYAQHESWYALPGYDVRLTQNNLLTSVMGGPQLILGEGPLRLQLHAAAGVSDFTTETTVGSTASQDRATNFESSHAALEAGLALLWRVHPRPPELLLGLGARYLRNGRSRYVTKDGIDTSTGVLVIAPREGPADLVVCRLGLTVGLAGPRD